MGHIKPTETADFRAIIERISQSKSSNLTVFTDFCRIAACSLACQTREDEYLEVVSRYSEEEINDFSKALAALILEMESKPFTDLLGFYYMEIGSKSSKNARGEFYTPPNVSELMAQMIGDHGQAIARRKPITLNEPCCGAGGMVLAFAKQFAPKSDGDPSYVDLVRATCQDISPLSCDMCYINTTLWGIPARIIWGDTLKAEIKESWNNIHWVRVGEDDRLKSEWLLSSMQSILNESQVSSDNDDESAGELEQISLGI